MLHRDDALALDVQDPLAPFLDDFVPAPMHGDPRRPVVYLDGNSLGRPPRRTIERINEVMLREWAGGLIRSWDEWLDLPQRVGDQLAPLIGVQAGEVAVHDSTTVDLFQLVHAAVALRPDRHEIAVEPGEFPTDRYVVDSVARSTGRQVRAGFDDLADVAVVVRSVVDYRTAAVVDLAAETARAHAAGALVLWDLSHAAGVLDIDLGAAGAQLAVGCTYKFLNGGPGSPAFTYVATELQAQIDQPIWGWFSQTDQFAMGPVYQPRTDIARVLVGTPSILALTGAQEGIALSARAGIDRIAEKARALTGFAIDLCDQWGLDTPTPRDAARRGGHVAVRHPDARWLVPRLASDAGVITDFREPDIVRLGLSPLTTTFADVWDGVAALRQLVD